MLDELEYWHVLLLDGKEICDSECEPVNTDDLFGDFIDDFGCGNSWSTIYPKSYF